MRRRWDEALQLLNSVTPDLILLDLDMPKMDGITFLKRLLDHPGGGLLPVIVISGESSGPVKKAKELGAREILVKAQFTPDELFSSIQRCLPA